MKSIKYYTISINIKPNYDRAFYNRGIIFSKLGKDEEAIKDYTRAIQINPYHVDAHNNRGLLYDRLKEKEKAIKDYSASAPVNHSPKSEIESIIVLYQLIIGQTVVEAKPPITEEESLPKPFVANSAKLSFIYNIKDKSNQ